MAPRYWELIVLSSHSGTNLTLGELQFRTVAGVSQVPSGGTPYASPIQGGFSAANLFDGNSATAWAAGQNNGAAGYDFGASHDAVELAITSWPGDPTHHPSSIIVRSSSDGLNWAEHLRTSVPNPGAGGVTQTFALGLALSQEEVSALGIHTQSGPSADTEAVASMVMHTVVGASPAEEWVSAVGMHTLRGGRAEMAAVDMLVMHTIFGPKLLPPPPPDTTTGPEPEVLPPDDCTDEGNQPEGCCVPEVNGLIETRVGPLNSIADIRAAIWYLQDRQNVLVREWNKLAAVTRTNFPRV